MKGLIVFVHGLHPLPWVSDYQPIEAMLKESIPDCELFMFRYWGSYWSGQNPDALAARLEQEIAHEVQTKNITKLYLVGHSYGALLLRRAILINMEATATSHWKRLAERVILLGGVNRGFLPYNVGWRIGAAIAALFQWLPTPLCVGQLALKGLRGSDWVTNLRMTWLSKQSTVPFTVQIRGTKDSLVGPHDSLDVSRSSNSRELVIDDMGHKDLALLVKANRANVTPKLKETIADALTAEVGKAEAPAMPPPDYVVFLIHGIRDFAEWHEDLGETIRRTAAEINTTVEVVPISYGYFSALQFLFPTARVRCARSFRDQYVQNFARNPDAVFSAVAHSNGTYALTWAMMKNRFIRLRHIFLAGSVLYRKFNWRELYVDGMKVRNECAAWDWPVGAICWFLRMLYWRRLGTSGVYGFIGSFVHPLGGGFVRNSLRRGGHSTALKARRHETIARFVLTGEEMSDSVADLSWWEKAGNVLVLSIARVIVAGIFVVFFQLYSTVAIANLAAWPTVILSAGITLLLVIVLLLV